MVKCPGLKTMKPRRRSGMERLLADGPAGDDVD